MWSFLSGLVVGVIVVMAFQSIFPTAEEKLVQDLKDEIARLKQKLGGK